MVESGKDIGRAAQLLANGELVAIPTETVYGLAANALDERAVARIFEAKGRPTSNPLIIHLAGADQLASYVRAVPDLALELASQFWPGPLTMLLPRRETVPDIVTAGLPRVAVRVPNHPMSLALLRQTDFPLAAPSANPFGYISPTKVQHVLDQLGDKIPYVLDGGDCQTGLESTIVGFEQGQLVVHRLGGIPLELLEQMAKGALRFQTLDAQKPLSPGMLPYHYSPRTPLLVVDEIDVCLSAYDPDKIGVISLDNFFDRILPEHQIQLSKTRDLAEAGRKLYQSMHRLDALGLKIILVERLPEEGLGQTMNDRLQRAASKR
ncbi:MAG: L-threonylcarbamoyladenylate synthase [Bacteroidota bacterium]